MNVVPRRFCGETLCGLVPRDPGVLCSTFQLQLCFRYFRVTVEVPGIFLAPQHIIKSCPSYNSFSTRRHTESLREQPRYNGRGGRSDIFIDKFDDFSLLSVPFFSSFAIQKIRHGLPLTCGTRENKLENYVGEYMPFLCTIFFHLTRMWYLFYIGWHVVAWNSLRIYVGDYNYGMNIREPRLICKL